MALSRSFVLDTEDGDKIHVDHTLDGKIQVRRAGSRSPAFSLTYSETQELISALGDYL